MTDVAHGAENAAGTCRCPHCNGGPTRYDFPPVHNHESRKFNTTPIPGCAGCACVLPPAKGDA